METIIKFATLVPSVYLIIISTIFAFFGDYFSKQFTEQTNPYYIFFPLALYATGTVFFIISLFGSKFTIANIRWNVFSILLGLILGFVIFKEQVTTLQTIGIVLAIGGIILMSIE